MKSYRRQALARALADAGLRRGDVAFIHSALFALGPVEGVPMAEIPEVIFTTLSALLGPSGTVVVPTFNFDFCTGERFDRQQTPSKGMGAFSEFVRTHDEAHRSSHPMQSVAAVGARAEELTQCDTVGAFDEDGSFEALLETDAMIVMLGCGINAVSMVHYAEERVGVPYRYQKEFSAPYRDGDRIDRRTYRMYVRDLELDPEVRVEPVGQILRRRGELRRMPLGQGTVEACRVRHFTSAAILLLQRDCRALIRQNAHTRLERLYVARG